MNKYLLLFSILFFSSCQKTVEDYARTQMKKSITEIAKNPKSLSFSDIENVFLNDSLCVLQFTLRGQNGFGGYDAVDYEYIYGINYEGKHYEYMRDLGEMSSILDPKIQKRMLRVDDELGESLEGIIMFAATTGREVRQ